MTQPNYYLSKDSYHKKEAEYRRGEVAVVVGEDVEVDVVGEDLEEVVVVAAEDSEGDVEVAVEDSVEVEEAVVSEEAEVSQFDY